MKSIDPMPYIYIGLIFSCMLFFTGLHDIDNAWNMNSLEKYYGDSFNDANAFNQKFSTGDLYGIGVILTFAGFVGIGLSSLFIGMRR